MSEYQSIKQRKYKHEVAPDFDHSIEDERRMPRKHISEN